MVRLRLSAPAVGAVSVLGAAALERCTGGVMNDNFVCCAASCGECGGPGCDLRPGGGAACCGGSIREACRSSAGPPPCVYWEAVAEAEAGMLSSIAGAAPPGAGCPEGSSPTPARGLALCTRDDFDLVDHRVRELGLWQDCEVLLELAQAIGERLRVLDAGAHIGACAVRLAAAGHAVAAFEPHPRSFAQLNASVRLNRLAADAAGPGLVEAQRLALAARRERRLMWEKTRNSAAAVALPEAQDPEDFVARSGHTHPSVPAEVRKGLYANASWAEAAPLDELRVFGSRPPRAFDLVKLDVNGGELGLLRGARLAFSVLPLVVKFEFWPDVLRALGDEPSELLRFFLERDYDLWVLDGGSGGLDTARRVPDAGQSLLDRYGGSSPERYTDVVALSRLRWPARASLPETLAR